MPYRLKVWDNDDGSSVDDFDDQDILRKEIDEAQDMLENGKIKAYSVSRVFKKNSKPKEWWDK